MIVCFDAVEGLNIYAIADAMGRKGKWQLSTHQNPTCVHMCVTNLFVGREQELLGDLRECVDEVVRDTKAGKLASGGSAGIYGMTASLPSGPINEILKVYNDVVLRV
jgi:hypothetical protein